MFDVFAYTDEKLKKAAEDKQKLVIKHPITNEPTEFVLDLIGIDAEVYQQARVKYFGIEDPTAADYIELIAAAIVGWSGAESDGKEWPYSPENAITLLSSNERFAYAVETFISDRQNFHKQQ